MALIEKHKMGGDCLNAGCVPSKVLISSAKHVERIRKSLDYGISVESPVVNFPNIIRQIQGVIDAIAPVDSIEHYTELGCDCFTDEATILSKHEVKVGDKILTTKHIVIASGGSPVIPSIPGLSDVPCLHSNNLWGLKELPKRLLIVGSGSIGCELAQAFSRLGSNVVVVSQDTRVLSKEDQEVSDFIESVFVEEGIELRLNAKVLKITPLTFDAGEVLISIGGIEEVVEFDKVFVAAGRKPNVDGLGLDNVALERNKDGTIKVNQYLQTSTKNIWACGDVTGPYQFSHMAAHQAGYVALNIFQVLLSALKSITLRFPG